MQSQPFGFAHLLCAIDFYMEKPKEIVLVTDEQDPGAAELVRGIHSLYLPNKTLQLAGPGEPLDKISPLLAGKAAVDGKTTAYVCHNFTCSRPVTTWEELKALLET
jgi:hypothetical protein